MNIGRTKTILLGLAVILITFTIFIALPAILPSPESVSCGLLKLGCSSEAENHIYSSIIWDTSEPPNDDQMKSRMIEILDQVNSLENYMRLGNGKLDIEIDPDGQEIVIHGYLFYRENFDDESMISGFSSWSIFRNRPIEIEYRKYYGQTDPIIDRSTTSTDSNGYFSARFDIDDRVTCYEIVFSYPGEEGKRSTQYAPFRTYLPCGAYCSTCEYENDVTVASGSTWWIWLVVGLVVVIIGAGIYVYLKHRKRFLPMGTKLPPTIEVIEAPLIPEKKEPEKEPETSEDNDHIEISFTDIEETLPSVWGVNEPLAVSFKLGDERGDPVSSQDCEIDWGDEEKIHLVSDEDGNIISFHVFTGKSEYVINASYIADGSGSTIASWRKIRIVDYREEMVRLFNEMLEKLELTDISTDAEMTPREIEEVLKSRLEGIDETALRRLITGFEEANYSTHPVTRDSYLNMYRSVNEVLGYGK